MQNVNMNIHNVTAITIEPQTVRKCSWKDSGEHHWQNIIIRCDSGEDIEITVHSDNPIDVSNKSNYTFATEVVENG